MTMRMGPTGISCGTSEGNLSRKMRHTPDEDMLSTFVEGEAEA